MSRPVTQNHPLLFPPTSDNRPGKVRRDAPATSSAAALAAEPVSGRTRQRVYACIRAAGAQGRTDQEIQTLLGMGESTERPRRGELVDSVHVEDSKRRRPTRSGYNAIVWVATGGRAR